VYLAQSVDRLRGGSGGVNARYAIVTSDLGAARGLVKVVSLSGQSTGFVDLQAVHTDRTIAPADFERKRRARNYAINGACKGLGITSGKPQGAKNTWTAARNESLAGATREVVATLSERNIDTHGIALLEAKGLRHIPMLTRSFGTGRCCRGNDCNGQQPRTQVRGGVSKCRHLRG